MGGGKQGRGHLFFKISLGIRRRDPNCGILTAILTAILTVEIASLASHKNIKCTALSKCFAGSWQENRSISQERSQMDLLFVRICDLPCEMCSK